MSRAVLIDYGCHSFTFRLASQLADDGFPIRYFANGALESPNRESLGGWIAACPDLIRSISCDEPYGKMRLHQRLRGEIEWAGRCLAALQQEQPSVIIVSCVPLAVLTRIHSWARHRAIPLIYWLQDMQGRAIYQLLGRKLGFPGRVLGAFAHLWEQQILEESRMIITIAPGQERELPYSVRRDQRFALLENWANIEEFPPLPPDNEWSRRHGLHDTLNVIYSGTLGLKHDLGAFLALASQFSDRPDVRVVVVSSGQAAEVLGAKAATLGFDNLRVLPFQPYEDVPSVLASAAVLIAPLDASAGSFCVPSKILSYLCAGRPTVIAIDSSNSAAASIGENGAGIVVPPGSLEQFVSAVNFYLNDSEARDLAGQRARAYAERTFNMRHVLDRFVNILALANIPIAVAHSAVSLLDVTRSAAV